MPVSPARELAYRILRRVESGRSFAVDLLQSPHVAKLREDDRRLSTELVMGVLRWRGELDFWIEGLSGRPPGRLDPEVATILRLAIYQVRFLAKIPKSAAANEAVELTKAARKRSAAGLVNAVVRKCEPPAKPFDPDRPSGLDSSELEAVRRSLPSWLLERWARNFGREAADALALKSLLRPRTVLRVAGAEGDRAVLQKEMASEGIRTSPGQFSPLALVVESGHVAASGAVREGRAVIQEEASQLVGPLVRPIPGHTVLDLCAAPGIKTGQLAAALERGVLLACDRSASRIQTMRRLLSGAIPAGVEFHVVRLDAARGLPFRKRFDRVLVDAPCSGTGTLQRNPEIKWRLRPEDIMRLAGLQVKMLRRALEVLAPGGRLVYATCSLEPEENEQVVEAVVRESTEFRLLTPPGLGDEFPSFSPLFDPQGYLRTRPDIHGMDGFFAAVLSRAS